MNIEPLTGTLGAEVTGLDLNRLTPGLIQQLEQAFHKHQVLAIRDQQLSPGQLATLTEQLGGFGETPYLQGMSDYPDVVPIVKEAAEQSQHSFGACWHTDFTFQHQPPSRTLLYGVDVPSTGGDTLFCNLYAAYEALSPGLQIALASLRAVHSAVRSYGPDATLKDHMENMTITNETTEPEEIAHPVIRTHPVTGKKALWVNPTYTIRFSGMTVAESEPLLNYLNSFAVQPGFTCRVKWRKGTLTMWDNRCTQHCATSDYRGERREMWRTTVAGEVPTAA